MAKLTLTYADLYTQVSNFLGLTAPTVAPTGTDLTVCKDIVDRGIRQFLYPIDRKYGTPHRWSFLEQYWSFSTSGDQWKYALPADFSELLTDFSHSESQALRPLMKRSGQQISKMRSITDTSGWPIYYAIVPLKYDIEIGTLYEIWLYPTPSQVYTFSTFYRADPIQLSATTDLVIGGISAIEAILESCLGVAEHQEDNNVTTHHQQKAEELIQKLIRFDAGKVDTDIVGNLYTGRLYGLDTDDVSDCSRFAYVDQNDIYSQS
jgi:hypothetical protein